MTEYNFYCDESCHLEHDDSNVMVLGAVWCPKEHLKVVNTKIKQIKNSFNIHPASELKWTKVSPVKIDVYKAMVNYFFEDKDLHFRGLLIPDKKLLHHEDFNQTHNEWYYKMYFDMLKTVISPTDRYNIFIDIKDTHSSEKANELRTVISNSMYDFSKDIIKQLKPIRSEEVQIMQLTDILIGAFGYNNRIFNDGKQRSSAKRELIQLIKQKSGYSLSKSTLVREEKLNLFIWKAK